ncbi:5355_t:CDS:2, partial [Cetraspora pellucida]
GEDGWHSQIPFRDISDLSQSPIENPLNTYDENDLIDEEADIRTRK